MFQNQSIRRPAVTLAFQNQLSFRDRCRLPVPAGALQQRFRRLDSVIQDTKRSLIPGFDQPANSAEPPDHTRFNVWQSTKKFPH
ncbi:MAG: hypothetical protein WA826_12715, partial [Silvibacterium sp.]